MSRSLDIAVSAFLLAVAILLFSATFSDQFDVPTFGGDIGPAAVPRAYLLAWMTLAAVALLQALRSTPAKDAKADPRKLLGVAVVTCGTGYAMTVIGFVFAAVPGLFLFCWFFGYRRPFQLAILSIAGPLLIWALFTYLFELLLPRSPWFHMM